MQTAPEIDGVTIEMVKQDLRRAESAVVSNLTEGFDLETGISELQEVWAGICNVTVQVSSRAKRALAKNPDSSYCVNEIAKEAVSNAVRHGEASEVQVVIDRIADDLLTLDVTNNGSQPKDQDRAGIGSEMLDEVCLHWELLTEKKQVRLVAELPIKL